MLFRSAVLCIAKCSRSSLLVAGLCVGGANRKKKRKQEKVKLGSIIVAPGENIHSDTLAIGFVVMLPAKLKTLHA